MEQIVDMLLRNQNRNSTNKNYLSIWRHFNKFLLRLDTKPKLWEDRATLFIGYLVDQGVKSTTIKCYISAIKKTLKLDGYEWDDNLVMVRSLAKACRRINDRVTTRLPIHSKLLDVLLFELQRHFGTNHQWYLEIMYKSLFAICYYGLMRVSEVAESPHALKAKNVHIAANKNKILLVLYTSKTHDLSNRPQKIKITSCGESGDYSTRHFCPFKLLRQFINIRGSYEEENEQFFIFRDGTPVKPIHTRTVLKTIINKLGLDGSLYGMHSFRIGRTTDLVSLKYSIEEIKLLGRWRSNVVFRYIKQ